MAIIDSKEINMNEILESHLKTKRNSTGDGIEMLHLYPDADRWSLNYAGNTYIIALEEIENMREKLEEIYRLTSLPADGSELRDGESDDPMTLLVRISQIAKTVLED